MFVVIWGHCELIQVIDTDFQFIADRELQWRHNERDGVSNRQPHDCLVKRLFRRRSKIYQSSAALAFVIWIHRWPVNSPHKRPVTGKMFPFDNVIMASVGHVVPPTCNRGREQMTAPIRRYTHSPLALPSIWINNGGLLQPNIFTPTNKAEDILQATFSNAFSWHCMYIQIFFEVCL